MQDKFCIGWTVEFCKAPFGVTPKTFDAVDVRFATCKFVFVMENAVVIIAIQNEAIVGFSTIGVNRRPSQDFPLNNRRQLFFRTNLDNRHKHFSVPF